MLRKSTGVATRAWAVSLNFSSKFVSLSLLLRSSLWSRVTVESKQQKIFWGLQFTV